MDSDLADAATRDASGRAAAIVRALVTELRVVPSDRHAPLGLEIVGDLAAHLSRDPDGSIAVSEIVGGCQSFGSTCHVLPHYTPSSQMASAG